MAYANYATVPLRASAATSGASEQDAAVTLPETVTELWVSVSKTAEANADNLLTVRLQCQVNSIWFDVGWNFTTNRAGNVNAADSADLTTRTPNIVDASSTPAFGKVAHYKRLPSNIVRIISISSGTAVANTFSADASFQFARSHR